MTQRMVMPPMAAILMVAVVAMAAGCGPRTVERYDAGTQTVVYVDEQVDDGGGPAVYVYPMDEPVRMPTAIVMPFRILQNMGERKHLGLELGRMFWSTWVRERVFTELEYYQNGFWEGPAHAVRVARSMGADLAVVGDVSHLYMGGTRGRTSMTLRVYVYDAATGKMLWSMSQSAAMESRPDADMLLWRETSRLPAEPLAIVMHAIASGMAGPVGDWLAPLREDEDAGRMNQGGAF